MPFFKIQQTQNDEGQGPLGTLQGSKCVSVVGLLFHWVWVFLCNRTWWLLPYFGGDHSSQSKHREEEQGSSLTYMYLWSKQQAVNYGEWNQEQAVSLTSSRSADQTQHHITKRPSPRGHPNCRASLQCQPSYKFPLTRGSDASKIKRWQTADARVSCPPAALPGAVHSRHLGIPCLSSSCWNGHKP